MTRFRMYPLRANNVLELYQQFHLINLDPPYQRLSVWDVEKQARFIDSVINGVDTPKFYFHELTGSTSSSPPFRFSVIDGKQRLQALKAFMDNALKLPGDFVYFEDENYLAAGMTYDQLLTHYPILRARFDSYNVPIVLVEADDIELIEELFWRLNIQVPLSAPEKRNALGGPLPLSIRKLALNGFFKQSLRIRNDRFQHLDLSAKFIYICHANGVVDTKKVILDDFVSTMRKGRENNEAFASRKTIGALEERTTGILEMAWRYFGRNNPLLGSVGRTTLYFHIFRVCDAQDIEIPIDIKLLQRFNAEVTAARQKSQRMSRGSRESLDSSEDELLAFDREKQSPNDRGAIERQYELLRRYLQRNDVELPVLK